MNRPQRRRVKMPKLSAWLVYGGVFVAIIGIITVGYRPTQENATESVATATQTPEAKPLVVESETVDKLVATDVAFNIAEQTKMSVKGNIAERVASLAVEDELAQTDDTAIVKPQIVQPTASSREIVTYTVKKGDTMSSIANAYDVSTETIRWANGMTNNKVTVGTKLRIPPVDGILYTVKSGDTLDSLVTKYNANKARIVSFNDLELTGLKKGQRIIIPGGSKPAPVQTTPSYASGGSSTGYGTTVSVPAPHYSGGNGYAYGYCTYYAAARRAALGKPIPDNWGNATSWAYYAAAQGFSVGSTPRAGAIMQSSGGYGGLGHVAIVEKVYPNGDILISEMNGYRFGGGWGVVGQGRIPKSQTYGFSYIY